MAMLIRSAKRISIPQNSAFIPQTNKIRNSSTNIKPMSCIFPVVNTTFRKAACITTGVTIGCIGIAGLSTIFVNNNAFKIISESTLLNLVIKPCESYPAIALPSLSMLFGFSTYIFYKDLKSHIFTEKNCCNIIKFSSFLIPCTIVSTLGCIGFCIATGIYFRFKETMKDMPK